MACKLNSECINKDKGLCHKCSQELGYEIRKNYYEKPTYTPSCPVGYIDCICDPSYIKFNYPEWYKELYEDKSIDEVVREHCIPHCNFDSMFCPHYDDEDK